MKRVSFVILTILTICSAQSQNISDGLRYATEQTNGTARFNALSGAFGALGGDLSAMRINPAGSAVFLTNSVSVSLSVMDKDNTSNYFNTGTNSTDTNLNFSQLGGVFVTYNSNPDSSWKKFSLGLNFDKTNNLDDGLFIAGNGNESIGDFFVQQAQGLPLTDVKNGDYSFLGERYGSYAQNAYLGYLGFIIDPVDANNPSQTDYVSNIAGNSFNQEYSVDSKGYNSKFTLNAAAQYGEDLFLGANLNIHSIDYDRSTFYFEQNSNSGSLVDQVGFQNNLSVIGSGFSLQAGAIYKIDNLRLGLTYDTPTWFTISEETSQSLQTRRDDNGTNAFENISPNVINVFEDYNLRTPGKVSASTAYIFGQKGLLSFDYSYKDYSNITFSPKVDPSFDFLNDQIDNSLKGASTYRVGAEYKINDLSVRGGYRYEESPYENKKTVEDLNGFSLGLGYGFGVYTFDVSYARAEQKRQEQISFLSVANMASVKTVYTNVMGTFTINL